MAQPEPDLLPDPEPVVTVAAEITCPRCGYTILTLDREMTEEELRQGLGSRLRDLQATIDRLTRQLAARGPEG